MNKTVKNIGAEFRKIRKANHFTMKSASKGIVSTATLSRWERGKQDLSVSIYYKLLDRINVSADEISPTSQGLFDFITKIGILYMNNEVESLRKESVNALSIYLSNKTKNNLLKAAIVCNYYLDLTNIDLTDADFKSMLTLQVCKIKNWYKTDLIFFANTQLLLKPAVIYDLADSLASYASEMNIVPDWQMTTLLNATFALIKKKTIFRVQGILHKVKKLNFSPNNYSAEYKEEFLDILLRYIKNCDFNEMEEFLSTLPNTKSGQQLKADLKLSILQIKEIYKIK